jgi:NIPSNAP
MAFLEIRTYRLRAGTRDDFVRAMREQAGPLLAAFGVRVIDSGPSLVDDEGAQEAYLIRVFDSLEQREAQETAFYGSAQWREGPREAIVSWIEGYHTVVLEVPDGVVAAWGQTRSSRPDG